MRRLIYIFIALISISCADKGNRKVSEKEPVNVGVLTVTPMSAQYYNVYVSSNYELNSYLNLFAEIQYRHINYDLKGIHDDLNDITQNHVFNFFI